MKWPGRLLPIAMVLLIVSSTTAAKEMTCDFENGLPESWKLSSSGGRGTPSSELEKNGDNTVLELGKNAVMELGNEQVLNFSIEATVRREYDMSGSHVGFQFRNGYRVYLRKPGRLELSGPKGAKGRGFSRNRVTHKPSRLKIVVVGPTVRFFVDGKFEGQFDELEMTPGPIALYQRGMVHNVYFDDVKLDTHLDPAQFLVLEPVTGDGRALVFSPDKDVNLKVRLHNHADVTQKAQLGIEVATFDDKVVSKKAMKPAAIEAETAKEVDINIGKIPEGLYRITFQPTGKTLPLAVHAKGTVTREQITMPKILTGVYWYYFGWQGLPEVWWNTYMHAACNDLRRHHFNTIICAIGMPVESIEIAGQYGIRCFTRGEGAKGNVSHPNVIGGFIGDEPHKGQEERYIKDYTRLVEKYPDKVWTTCMIGDGGVEGCNSWWDTWTPLSETGNVVRMMRWYGIKKYLSGITRPYGSAPALTETLRGLSRGKGPYYFIMPSFGDPENVNAYFSSPLPSQIRCMMHLAAAFQARGLFFWTYQTPFPKHDALVDPVTLLPLDGKWAAAGEAAASILKNAGLLAECTWGGRYAFVAGSPLLEAFRLNRKDDPAQYFYLVNKDTDQSANGRLYNLDVTASLRDLFADKEVPITEDTVVSKRSDLKWVSGAASVKLKPGDGVLLKYAPAAVEEGTDTAVAAAMPRVVYPKTVAGAPADKILWLADIKPIEMPQPGWIPQIKFRGKVWFPDFNSNDLNLYSGPNDSGQLYKKSLWAHAETTIKYHIPEGAVTFAAAAGFANKDQKSSAIFRVVVDGKENYNSGVMKLGTPVKSVVVDIAGGKMLVLLTEEAGDGLYGDYTFWGEARLIKK